MSKPLSVYVAAPWKSKKRAKIAIETILASGIPVVSTWVYWDVSKTETESDLIANAQSDWKELQEADIFIQLNWLKSPGKATELGASLIIGKTVIVVDAYNPKGDQNIFYHLPQVIHVKTLAQAIEKVKLLTALRRYLTQSTIR